MHDKTYILLADDDGDDIEMFQSAVSEYSTKVKVSTAGDGLKLIDLLEKGPAPDVIVLDLHMPRKNGYDCLKTIRKDKKYKTIPIVVLSTSSSIEDIQHCLLNGANHYIVKPSTFKDLVSVK